MELQQIGASHPRIKQVIDLQKNTKPNPQKLFVAEGLWAHNALLEADTEIATFLWCPEAAYSDEAMKRSEQVAARAGQSFRVSEKTLARVSERDKPDGLLSVARLPQWDPALITLPEDALIMVADAIEIPGNLGTLIRTLDAVGADLLVLTNRRTRLTHPKVFRASHGMVLTVPTLEFDEVADAGAWLLEHNVTTYLADTGGTRTYREMDCTGRTAILLGNERYGISRPWYEFGFEAVSIPMLGRADSLNVSISAAVLLCEARARKAGW
jgi:TrmH family RNA methyltransferase